MTNDNNRVLYTGVTSDLKRRVFEHKSGSADGFTKKYNVKKLVYYETAPGIEGAIAREKQIKSGSRMNKIKLIEASNPDWLDLYDGL